MRYQRMVLLAAAAGLGLALTGCRSNNPCDPCSERRGFFGRLFRPCSSSPAPLMIESGLPISEDGPFLQAPGGTCCQGDLMGPPLGTPGLPMPNGVAPQPGMPQLTTPPRLVPQPQSQPVPYNQ